MPLYGESELSCLHCGSLRETADALINTLNGTEFKTEYEQWSSKKETLGIVVLAFSSEETAGKRDAACLLCGVIS